MTVKMSKQPPPAPTASAVGPCPTEIQIVGRPDTGFGWLVGLGFNGPLRQYFSLHRAVPQREEKRGKKGWMRLKMSKQPPPAPTASAVGPCPTVIQIVGRPGTRGLPRAIAHPDHPTPPPTLEVYPAPSHHPTTPQ